MVVVGENLFRGLNNLKVLILASNKLKFIHPRALPPVQNLYLQYNQLTYIPHYIFDHMRGGSYGNTTNCGKFFGVLVVVI